MIYGISITCSVQAQKLLDNLEKRLTNIGKIPPKRSKVFDGKLSAIARSANPAKKPRITTQPNAKTAQTTNAIKQRNTALKAPQKQTAITTFLAPKSEPVKVENDNDWSDDEEFASAVVSADSSNSVIAQPVANSSQDEKPNLDWSDDEEFASAVVSSSSTSGNPPITTSRPTALENKPIISKVV